MPQSIDINHTELFSDRVVDLVKAGVITNKRKKIYPGIGGQMDFIRGAVNLHGLSLRQRAERLISIAHPDFRSELRTQLMAVRHYLLEQ